MNSLYTRLDALLRSDAGARGFSAYAGAADMDALVKAFAAAKCALIITGFPVEADDGHICCETDGPIGAAHIARAFCDAGKRAYIATDELCYPQLAAAVRLRAPNAELIKLNGDMEELMGLGIDTVISIERPGKALDGHCHTAKGRIIDGWLGADTDEEFESLHKHGAKTIAIGDGGNELGTGKLFNVTRRVVDHGEDIAAAQTADITLASGVSNWWGWGIAAIASVYLNRNVLPDEHEERAVLRAILDAGAVDGITKRSEESIDNIDIDKHIALLNEVNSMVKNYLDKQAE